MYEFFLPGAARARYDALLQEAAQERLAYRVRQAQRPARTSQLLLLLSEWLIATGNWLKARHEMRPSLG